MCVYSVSLLCIDFALCHRLEIAFRRLLTLSKGDLIRFQHNKRIYYAEVLELQPADGVHLIDVDLKVRLFIVFSTNLFVFSFYSSPFDPNKLLFSLSLFFLPLSMSLSMSLSLSLFLFSFFVSPSVS